MPDNYSAPRFDIRTEVLDRTVVMTVTGDIDMSTTSEFESQVVAALSASPTALVVDLTAVGFLGTSAMTVLVSAHDRVGADSAIVVVADKPATRRPFELVGLTDVLSVHPTRAEALDSVSPR